MLFKKTNTIEILTDMQLTLGNCPASSLKPTKRDNIPEMVVKVHDVMLHDRRVKMQKIAIAFHFILSLAFCQITLIRGESEMFYEMLDETHLKFYFDLTIHWSSSSCLILPCS